MFPAKMARGMREFTNSAMFAAGTSRRVDLARQQGERRLCCWAYAWQGKGEAVSVDRGRLAGAALL